MELKEKRSLSVFSRKSKADSINYDLKNMTVIKKSSFDQICQQKTNQKHQNPRYQSSFSSNTYIFTTKNTNEIEQITYPRVPRTSLLKRSQGNFLFQSKSKYQSDEQYRLQISYSIVAFSFILMKIINVSTITDSKYDQYRLTKKLINKGYKIIQSLPKINDIFYEHTGYLGIILRYQMEDIFKNDPNLVYKIHNLPKNTQKIESTIKIKAKQQNSEKLYFRQLSSQHLLNVLQKLLIKNNLNYLQLKVNALKPKQYPFPQLSSLSQEIQITNSLNKRKQLQKIKSQFVIKFNHFTKQYTNIFIKSQDSFFKYPQILINIINKRIYQFYNSKSSVIIFHSLRQNHIFMSLIVSLVITIFLIITIIHDKLIKYLIIGIILVVKLGALVLYNCRIKIEDHNALKKDIKEHLLKQPNYEIFRYQMKEDSLDIKITVLRNE